MSAPDAVVPDGFSQAIRFQEVVWDQVPDQSGVYVIYDGPELLYVGMAGREGKGSLRKRLKDHSSGQVVNMFAQYLFLARVQFTIAERVTHPMQAKQLCQAYIRKNCWLAWRACESAAEARVLEAALKQSLKPVLNGHAYSGA